MTSDENRNELATSPQGNEPFQLTSSLFQRGLSLLEKLDLADLPTTLKPMEISNSHEDGISCLAFSKDGEWFASSSWDHRVFIWSTKERKVVNSLIGHRGKVRKVYFLEDGGKLITVGDDKRICFWDIYSNELLREISDVSVITISGTGKFALVLNEFGGLIQLMDLHNLQKSKPFSTHIYQVQVGTISPDESMALIGGRDGSLFYLNLKTHAYERLAGLSDWVWTVGFNDNGDQVLSAGADGLVQLIDLNKKDKTRILSGHLKSVFCALFSSDQKYIISTSADKTLRLWDKQTLVIKQVVKLESEAISLAVSKLSHLVACGCRNGAIYLWTIE
jgi:WD40 repeat protein